MGPIADGLVVIFGFKDYQPDGVHFGWARMQGTNGHDFAANLLYNFDYDRPPQFSEITINPVPWAAIQLGRPSPGGPRLEFATLSDGTLRLSYPDWCSRYAVRRRSIPKGLVTKIYQSGREGLTAADGVFTLDVPPAEAAGFFELFLPPINRDP